jgi:hypothetical protein
MNHELSLALELLDQSACGFLFRLTAHNRSAVKLLLPFPEIHGIRFGNTRTTREAEWYTHILQSTAGNGFTLDPGAAWVTDWPVRPCGVAPPAQDEHSDYARWCVELPAGEYSVWFQWSVDADYFDPDSHMRLPDLERMAARAGAVVWQGQAVSNRLRLMTT